MCLSQLLVLKENAKMPQKALEALCTISGAAHEHPPRAADTDSKPAEKETPKS